MTRIVLVPTLLEFLLDEMDNIPFLIHDLKLKYVVSSGESLSLPLALKFFEKFPPRPFPSIPLSPSTSTHIPLSSYPSTLSPAPSPVLLNLYGSTEVMGDVSFAAFSCKEDILKYFLPSPSSPSLSASSPLSSPSSSYMISVPSLNPSPLPFDKVPIGFPIPNVFIEIRESDPSLPAELFIYGKGVNPGYFSPSSSILPASPSHSPFHSPSASILPPSPSHSPPWQPSSELPCMSKEGGK